MRSFSRKGILVLALLCVGLLRAEAFQSLSLVQRGLHFDNSIVYSRPTPLVVFAEKEDPFADTNVVAGDLAIIMNNAFGFDFYVISRHSTQGQGVFAWFSNFFMHSQESLNHAAAISICWLTACAAVYTYEKEQTDEPQAIKSVDEDDTELVAAKKAAVTVAAMIPLAAMAYAAGGALYGDPSRFSLGNFGVEVYFNLLFLVAWRVVYWRWKQGIF